MLKLRAFVNFWVFLSLILLGSCASYFKRKECEKTNWFSLGETIALRGERPDADKYVQECKAIEANINSGDLDKGFKKGMAQYCTVDQALKTGKEGLTLNEEFCEPAQIKVLKMKYLQGLNDYCSVSGGKRIGSEGKIYTKICKGAQEEAFLKGYQPARKSYLLAAAAAMEKEIVRKESLVESKESKLRRISREKSSLEGRRYKSHWVVTADPLTGRESRMMEQVEDRSVVSQIDFLNLQESTLDSEISTLRKEMDGMAQRISEMQSEAAAL